MVKSERTRTLFPVLLCCKLIHLRLTVARVVLAALDLLVALFTEMRATFKRTVEDLGLLEVLQVDASGLAAPLIGISSNAL